MNFKTFPFIYVLLVHISSQISLFYVIEIQLIRVEKFKFTIVYISFRIKRQKTAKKTIYLWFLNVEYKFNYFLYIGNSYIWY